MKYCRRCVQPDTRPNTLFTPEGLCPTCAYADDISAVDWAERHEELRVLIAQERERRRPGQHFDCIIGVSGGKDSTRQAIWARDALGLKPLLVCLSFPPQQVSTIGTDNVSNLINLGFDVVVSAPSPETWRGLMRESFFRFTNWARSTELALFSSVPQLAIRYGIRLILWGENPALQVGDLKAMGRNGWDGNNLRFTNTLSSGHEWMEEIGITPQKLIPYRYPSPGEFDDAEIQIIFLGWFLGDWSLKNNAAYACAHGLRIRSQPVEETGDLLGISNLDEDWHNMNQMVKYYKFGFGKVTEYVNESVRAGEMTRETAVRLVEQYDGVCSPAFVASFCEFIGISVDEFWTHVRKSVNPRLFDIAADGTITRKFAVGTGLS